MIWIEAVDGEDLEPWEAESHYTQAIERRINRIMSECPTCEHCGAPVDIYGVYGTTHYYDYGGWIFHKKCFPEWLMKNPAEAVELAMETADNDLEKPVKEYTG